MSDTTTTPDALDEERRVRAARELDRLREVGEWPPRTSVPCPAWCGMPAGHGYDSILPLPLQATGDRSVSRSHELELAVVALEDDASASVSVDQFVTAPGDEGPEHVGGPTLLSLWLPMEGQHLTAEQARKLAAALLEGAAALECIQRGEEGQRS